jgi:Protein of unknown function (DUF3040)
MSTRDDARLTAQERAAFAGLEAAAAADDPQLAKRLRGSNGIWIRSVLSRTTRIAAAGSQRLLHLGWWGIPIAVVGLLLVVVSMSAGLVLGVVGALISAFGLYLVARTIRDRRAPTPDSD